MWGKCQKNSKFAIVLFRPSPWELKQKEIEIQLVFCVRYYLEVIEDLTQILTWKEIETHFKFVHHIIRMCFVNEASWLSSSAASTCALALSDSSAEHLLSPMFKHHDR